jgi:hypothetical protein
MNNQEQEQMIELGIGIVFDTDELKKLSRTWKQLLARSVLFALFLWAQIMLLPSCT